MDMFASPTNTKVPGAYYSQYLGPGCKGLDSFSQKWGGQEKGQLAYINGPFGKMGQILKKVLEERVDCIIIAPSWPRPWSALWKMMPVRERVRLSHKEGMFRPGSMVPVTKQARVPRYEVAAYFVLWN